MPDRPKGLGEGGDHSPALAMPMLCLSTLGAANLAATIAARLDRPIACTELDAPLTWYEPPDAM